MVLSYVFSLGTYDWLGTPGGALRWSVGCPRGYYRGEGNR